MCSKALFLDRDGTLIIHRPYLNDPAQVELLDGVCETLRAAQADGYLLFLFTNQSGVGRGYYTLDAVQRCNVRMLELLGLSVRAFTEVCIPTERPDEPSLYRKPSPRFILEMVRKHALDPHQSWMVGDAITDVAAGLGAGINAALVGSDESVDLPPGTERHRNLAEFYSARRAGSAPAPAP